MPSRPGGYSRSEQGRRRSVYRTRSTTCEFVQGAVGETAARQDGIDLGHAERQTDPPLRRAALKRGDTLAQISQYMHAGSRHRSRNPSGSR